MTDHIGKDIPKLGFGLMRLPMQGTEVDVEHTQRMVDAFLAHGYTYFDTAWGYLGGKSEEIAKTVLTSRYPRESYQFATKLPAWAAQTPEEAKAMLDTSLRRTGLEYFDFYLLHSLGGDRTEMFDRYGLWEYLAEQKKAGVIRNLGFSIHGTPEHLEELLQKHPEMDFVQLQINYGDWEDSAVQSRRNYEIARRHGKPVVVMEPVKGGNLANPPPPVAALLREADPEASFASWALRYAAGLPGIVTVLSGMSDMAQMEDNLKTMDNFRPLDERERAVIAKAQEILAELPSIPCTDCHYCTPGCPQGIEIPDILSAMNLNLVYGNLAGAKRSYGFATADAGKASACVACGECEKVCPQGIHITDELQRAADMFEA